MLYNFYSTVLLHSPETTLTSQSWQFDIVSALIGAAVALLLAGLAYHLRNELRLGWDSIATPLSQLFRGLQASTEDHYRKLVATRMRSLCVPAHVASLDAIFVEPELLSPSPPPQSTSDVEALPTGSQTLPLRRILGGHPKLVILGSSGAGKTSLLAYVALACTDNAEAGATLGLDPNQTPLYVPIPEMEWNENGKEHETDKDENGPEDEDGIDRLVSAAVAAVGGNKGLTKALHQRLKDEQAIVLADGWDALSSQQRQRAGAWLSGLVDALPGNLWLVGAGQQGYAPLTEAGFVPLTLAAWDAGQVEKFASQWVEVCTPADTTDNGKPPVALHKLVTTLWRAARAGDPPVELALRAFVVCSDGQAPAKRAPLFDRALDLLLQEKGRDKDPWLSAVCRAVLGQVALSLQQEGCATVSREELGAAIESALPPSEELPARAATHVLQALTDERGLLRPAGSNRYVFVHPLWQAYLAARQLVASDPANLTDWLDDPHWAEVLRFYAEIGDMRPLVAAWLRDPDDLFCTRLRTLSSWISAAPEDATWRDGATAVLARGFLKAGHPMPVRKELAEALAATGMSGVTYLFKQALQHPDAGMRTAATWGLTRAAGESDLAAIETALTDADPAVREAAVRGLARLGTDAATRWLAQVLLEEDETLSLAAAEALAQCGEEGIAFLSEAIESEDAIIRRGAVVGLAQVGMWDVLEKVAREDEQWIVRSAATAALEEWEERETSSGVVPPPEIEQLPWLISWAAGQGEGIGLGDAARPMLWQALSKGDVPTRVAAAHVLAQIGRPDDVEPLRAVLAVPDPDVARAALEALAEISKRYELRIE